MVDAVIPALGMALAMGGRSFPKRDEAYFFPGLPCKVDPHSSEAHFSGMAAVLKCLLTFGLRVVFLAGVTAKLLPASTAGAQMTAHADMAGGCTGHQPPFTGHMPNCLDHGGCITVSALPASPTTIDVPVEWTSLDYALAPQALAGICVKPELTPPILVT
jgi:hypothetical protein